MAPDGVDSGVTPTDRVTPVPIGDHGFLSDGEVSALLAPDGAVTWMCVPRFDSPSVFGSILGGRRAGDFRLAPLDVGVPAQRRYLPGTMILETSWGTPTGWIIVRDVLLIGPWHHARDRSVTYRRTPTDYEAEHVLLRTVRCVSGEVQTVMDCEPVLDYGRGPSTGSTPATPTTRARRRPRTPTSGSPSPPTCSSASKVGRPAPAPCSRRATSATSPCRGVAPSHR